MGQRYQRALHVVIRVATTLYVLSTPNKSGPQTSTLEFTSLIDDPLKPGHFNLRPPRVWTLITSIGDHDPCGPIKGSSARTKPSAWPNG